LTSPETYIAGVVEDMANIYEDNLLDDDLLDDGWNQLADAFMAVSPILRQTVFNSFTEELKSRGYQHEFSYFKGNA